MAKKYEDLGTKFNSLEEAYGTVVSWDNSYFYMVVKSEKFSDEKAFALKEVTKENFDEIRSSYLYEHEKYNLDNLNNRSTANDLNCIVVRTNKNPDAIVDKYEIF